jgi:RNA polymerase sigma-70 factor (ECF subfamily)
MAPTKSLQAGYWGGVEAPPNIHRLEALLAHADWLERLARHLATDDVAHDAVQETWLAAMRAPPAADRPPRPWLAQVVRNFLRKRVRTAGRQQRREEAAQDLHAEVAPADQLYERVELQRLLAEHVMALDEPYRRTVLLRYFDGRKAIEIARLTGVPEGTVRWRLKQALDRLRGALDRRHGGDRRKWALVLIPPRAPLISGLWKGIALMAKAKLAVPVVALLVALVAGVTFWQHALHRPSSASSPHEIVVVPRAHGELRVFGAAAPSAVEHGSVEGLVRDRAGRPVAGAMVSAGRAGAGLGSAGLLASEPRGRARPDGLRGPLRAGPPSRGHLLHPGQRFGVPCTARAR